MQSESGSIKERLLANRNKKYSKKENGGELDSVSDMLPTKEPMTVMEQPDMGVINPIDVTQTIQPMENGGSTEDFNKVWNKFKSDTAEAFTGKKAVYVDFLNSKNAFKRERKYFSSYEEAHDWCKANFDKFSPDMIHYNYYDGGMTSGERNLKNLKRYVIEIQYYSGKIELKYFANYSNALKFYDELVDNEKDGGSSIITFTGEIGDREYVDIRYFDPREDEMEFAGGGGVKGENQIYVLKDEDADQIFRGKQELDEYLDEFNFNYETNYKTYEEFNEGEKNGQVFRRIIRTYAGGGNIEPSEYPTVMSGEITKDDIREMKENLYASSPDTIYEVNDQIDYWGMETMNKGGETMRSIPIMNTGQKVSNFKNLGLRQDKDNQIKDLIAKNKNDYLNFSQNELSLIRSYQANSSMSVELADKIWGLAVANGFKIHGSSVYIKNTGTGNLLEFVSENYRKVYYESDSEMSRKICRLLYPQENIEILEGLDYILSGKVIGRKDLCIYANFDDNIISNQFITNCSMVIYCGYHKNVNEFQKAIPNHHIVDAYKLPDDILTNGVIIAFKSK